MVTSLTSPRDSAGHGGSPVVDETVQRKAGEQEKSTAQFGKSLNSPSDPNHEDDDFNVQHLRKTVETKKTELGDRHHDTLEAMMALEMGYRFEGQFEESEKLIRQVIAVKEVDLGQNHRETLACKSRLAEVTVALGDDEVSQRMQREILETRRKVLGEHDEDTVNSMEQLAIWHQNKAVHFKNDQDLKESERFYEMVFEANTAVHGPDHEETYASGSNLAAIRRLQGRLDQAETLQAGILEKCKRVLGSEHIATANHTAELARIYYAQGRVDESKRLLQQAVKLYRTKLGDDDPLTEEAEKELADMNEV